MFIQTRCEFLQRHVATHSAACLQRQFRSEKNFNYSHHQSFLTIICFVAIIYSVDWLYIASSFSSVSRLPFANISIMTETNRSFLKVHLPSFLVKIKRRIEINKRYVKLNIQSMKAPRRFEAEKNSWHGRLYSTVFTRRRNALISTRATHVCQQTGVR